ncbi:MAG: hypothetical protein ICV56_05540, partial [Nitrososphaeraceae archaeon]|nr:hypothetical protein [Nitrososphaeraceae archaeon]
LDASSAVAFDSYYKENDICRTEYGDEEFKHVIEYPNGITMDHVMASMSTHLKHRYPQMKVKYNEDKEEEEQPRLFWDGAYLSNTPLKELLHEHRYYWHKVKKEKVKLENAAGDVEEEILIPDLEIYIINLYPSVENEVPMNADAIQDREIDIKFHDRTKNDVKYAQLATDYIELIEQIRNLGFKHAQNDEDFKKDYDALLNKLTKSKKRTGIRRKYKDLLEGRSDITKVVYVDRSDDGNTVFGKAFEFSSNTVNQLERAGYEDAEIAIEIESVRDAVINLITNGIVTQEEGLVFEEKLQAAIAHAKHKDIDKSRDKLTELVKIAIAIVEGKTSQKEITREMLDSAQLFGSAQLLDLQLMISQNTLMVNKGLMSQNEADILKEKLQAAKRTIKDQIAVAKRRGENI